MLPTINDVMVYLFIKKNKNISEYSKNTVVYILPVSASQSLVVTSELISSCSGAQNVACI